MTEDAIFAEYELSLGCRIAALLCCGWLGCVKEPFQTRKKTKQKNKTRNEKGEGPFVFLKTCMLIADDIKKKLKKEKVVDLPC